MKDYHINIFFSDEDGGYIADIPDLKFCSAFGHSPEEALQEVLLAKKLWLDSTKNNDETIPKPRYKPAHYQLV